MRILFDSVGGASIIPGISMPRTTGPTGEAGLQQDYAVVTELQIKPTAFNPILSEFDESEYKMAGRPAPEGVHFIYSGDVALTDPDNPLPYAETDQTDEPDLDFDSVDYHWMPDAGYYSPNFLTDLLFPQMSLNRVRSQMKESFNAFAHPKALVPMGSRIQKGAFADIAGEVIEYVGVPPSYLEPPSMRPFAFRILEDEQKMINDISMLHEVTREGRVPPQVRTAAGLQQLQEVDNNALRIHIEAFEESEAITGQKMLDRVKQFYDDERVVEWVGERNRMESMMFLREPFFQNRWRVFVHPGSAFPESRAVKIAQGIELLQYAPWVFVDRSTQTPDRSLFARLIGMEDFDEFMQDLDESRQAAEYENAQMLDGIQIQPLPFEEDIIHLQSHYALMRSPDFRRLDPEIQQIVLQHSSAHEQQIQKKIQAQSQVSEQIGQAASAGAEAVQRQAAAEAAAAEARPAAREAVEQAVAEQFVGGGGNGAPGRSSSNQLVENLMRSGMMRRALQGIQGQEE